MKRASLFLAAVLLLPVSLLAQGPRTITIEGTDNMKFSVAEITASPGEQIRVVLQVTGSMPRVVMAHNFVLLKAGVDATAFANASVPAGAAKNYIADAERANVLASTDLAGGGETVEVTFEAPAAGSYTFLCSFPGHFAAGMTGTLIVR